MAVVGGSCFSRCSSKSAGTSLRLLRSPEPPKMTIVAGSVGIALFILSSPASALPRQSFADGFRDGRPVEAHERIQLLRGSRRRVERDAHLPHARGKAEVVEAGLDPRSEARLRVVVLDGDNASVPRDLREVRVREVA